MKAKNGLTTAIIFILFLSGCIPSLHQLYHDEDLVFKPEILGTWKDNNGSIWNFKTGKEKNYQLNFYENPGITNDTSSKGEFVTHLVNLGEYYFLDLYPGENNQLNMPSLLISTFLPVHIFAKVEFADDHVQVRFFDPSWLENIIDENLMSIAYEKTDNYYVLTASTDELQRFVIKYAEVDEAFVDVLTLEKSE